MKLRTDLVTNSSSLVYIIIKNKSSKVKTIKDFINEYPSMRIYLSENVNDIIFPNDNIEISLGSDEDYYEDKIDGISSTTFDVNFKYTPYL